MQNPKKKDKPSHGKKKNDKPVKLTYAEIDFDEDPEGVLHPVIRGNKPEPTEYSEVQLMALPGYKKKVKDTEGAPHQRMVYENVEIDGEKNESSPEKEIFNVIEDHKCYSMSANRLTVRLGDYVQAEKVEPGRRALCFLLDNPDSCRGWIPINKLKPVYTNCSTTPAKHSPKHSITPIQISNSQQVPVLPPKSPDPVLSPKRHKHHDAHLDQLWFVGKMSRTDCEISFNEMAKEGNFVIRESTYRIGDYTLSVQYEGRVRHFPIQITEDEKYYIGKHGFKNLCHVISYYQKHPLFFDDHNNPVSLGYPLGHIPSSC